MNARFVVVAAEFSRFVERHPDAAVAQVLQS